MPFDRFMIAPIQGGLQNDLKPWIIPDDAFEELNNAYIFRGRVRKRFGSRLMNGNVDLSVAQLSSRLRVQVGTIGSPVSPVPGTKFNVGSLLSAGAQIFTVYQTGTPAAMLATGGFAQVGTTDGTGAATGTTPSENGSIGQTFEIGTQVFTVTLSSGALTTSGPGSGTFNTSTGAFTFTGAAINSPILWNSMASGTFNTNTGAFVLTQTGLASSTPIYFYPAQPVMGLIRYETDDSTADPTYAFDTQFAYTYTAGAWARLGTGIWTGTDSQFFWGTNWRGALASDRILFVVNNNAADGIQYYSTAVGDWTKITPQVLATPTYLFTSLILIVYKGYMVALNTTEGADVGSAVQYTNRARWARYGNPIPAGGPDANIWRSDVAGNGNFVEAATNESIVSCGFIKDQLVVYFERSTWTLKQTNNFAAPFSWFKVNTELGAESTFSAVPFDKVLLAIANVGIHACTGTNVDRIDEKIPNVVWDIHTGATEVDRVYGIRDFYAEQVYWTFPQTDTNAFSATYPNKVLVYNYKTGSWAFNDDSITAFGYYYAATQSAVTWASTDIFWDNTEVLWSSGAQQPLSQDIIAGNQEGFTFIIDADETSNAPALQITNLTLSGGNVSLNVINHNLNVTQMYEGDFVYIQFLNGLTGPFTSVYPIIAITDANNFIVLAPDMQEALALGQVYTGGGTVSRISRINFLTKQFNFYVQDDRNSYVQKVNFLVDRTASGQITVDYLTSTSSQQGIVQAQAVGAQVGTGVLETTPYALYPLEQQQDRLWHPIYFNSDGTSTQLSFYLSNAQMSNYTIAISDFQLGAMCFYCVRTSSRLQ